MKFLNEVYKAVGQIPRGKVSTYKQIGEKINSKAYQAIGQALKNNPSPILIPCHRVVRSNGEIGGYFGKTDGDNLKRKIRLLESEGIRIENNRIVDFETKKII